MKKILIAVVALILLIGGTMVALKLMHVGPFEEVPGEAEVAPEEKSDEGSSFFGERPRYVVMDPIQVPMFQDGSVAGTIMIHYKIEVLTLKNESLVAKSKRQIGDALIQDFSYYLPRTLRNNKTLDVSLVKYRIIMITERLMGKGVINDALIQAMTSTEQ